MGCLVRGLSFVFVIVFVVVLLWVVFVGLCGGSCWWVCVCIVYVLRVGCSVLWFVLVGLFGGVFCGVFWWVTLVHDFGLLFAVVYAYELLWVCSYGCCFRWIMLVGYVGGLFKLLI